MPVDTKVRAALKLKKLKLPPKPRVLSIEPEDFVDWEGEEALRIWVVIAEDTTDEELLNGRATIELTRAIRDSLRAKGVTLFPYISFTKPSEQRPDDEEE